jgi:hypothetical protein
MKTKVLLPCQHKPASQNPTHNLISFSWKPPQSPTIYSCISPNNLPCFSRIWNLQQFCDPSRLSNLQVNKFLLFTTNTYELQLLYQSHHVVKPPRKNIKEKSYKNAESNVLDGYELRFNEEDPHLLYTFAVVRYLLGNSLAFEFYMPTFRNTLSVPAS